MVRKLTLTLAFLGGIGVTPAAGQVQVGLSALAGGFLPISDLFESVVVQQRAVINLGQNPALAMGGRLTLWLRRFGVEAEAVYALSGVDVPQGLVDLGAPEGAYVFLGSINALYVLYQAPFSPLSVHLSGGGGIVARGGEFFDTFEDTTDLAGTLGLGIRFGLGRATRLRVDLRDYVSTFQPTRIIKLDSHLQNDLIATVAIEVVLSPTP